MSFLYKLKDMLIEVTNKTYSSGPHLPVMAANITGHDRHSRRHLHAGQEPPLDLRRLSKALNSILRHGKAGVEVHVFPDGALGSYLAQVYFSTHKALSLIHI